MEESNASTDGINLDCNEPEPDLSNREGDGDVSYIRSGSEESEADVEQDGDGSTGDESEHKQASSLVLNAADFQDSESEEDEDAELCAIYGNDSYATLWSAALQIDSELNHNQRLRRDRRGDGDDSSFFERFATLKDKSQQNSRWNTPSPPACLEPEAVRALVEGLQATPLISGSISPVSLDGEGDDKPKPRPRSRPRSRLSRQTSLSLESGLVLDDSQATTDALYEQVLFANLHTLGVDLQEKVPQEDLWQHLRAAVGVSEEKHLQLLDQAQQKPAPEVLLHLNVLEGRGLLGKDVNGLSDPFCAIWVSSHRQSPVNTSMKPETLHPVWKESFVMPVKNVGEDVLTLEVWDYDPEESVRDKMGRFNQVKGCRGLKKLMREIAVASSASGKPAHEFLGVLNVPLKYVPISGVERWYPLDGRSQDKVKNKGRGDIRLRLLLCTAQEDSPTASALAWEQHEHLTALLLDHDIRNDKEWSGSLSTLSEAILEQHSAHLGLRKLACHVIRLRLLVRVLSQRWVDWHILASAVDRVLKRLDDLAPEQETIFWETGDGLVTLALSMIRQYRLRQATSGHPQQLRPMLKVLKDLFAMAEKRCETNRYEHMPAKVTEALTMGAADWMSRAVHQNPHRGEINDDDRLVHCISISQFLMTDLQKVLDLYNPLFSAILQIPAFAVCYQYYDTQLCALCQPVVQSMCRSLKGFDVSEEDVLREAWNPDPTSAPAPLSALNMGTALFELYLTLQQFHKLSAALRLGPDSPETATIPTKVGSFHTWFSAGVSRWLDIALYKALQRIVRAVLLDSWKPMDHLVKHSSSAVDTMSIFYQIKTFWKQLSWPDPEGALAFVTKIIDDVCRCSVFYAEVIEKHLARQKEERHGTPFAFTPQLCLALNNIVYVQSCIQPLVADLGWEEEVALLTQPQSAEHCRSTVKTLVENTLDNLNYKMEQLLEDFGEQVAEHVRVLLQFNWSEDPTSSASLSQKDALFRYLDDNLVLLNKHVDPEVFQSALNRIARHVLTTFQSFVQAEVEGKRHPSFFRHVEKLLDTALRFFFGEEASESSEKERTEQIRNLLHLHAVETAQLIHQYKMERSAEPSEDATPKYGALSVRALFVGDTLQVELLNAKNLRRMDATGSSDPYVKVALLPSERFVGQSPHKTKVHKNTLFPLFEEMMTFTVPADVHTKDDSLVWFVVKDHDFLGKNEFSAEAFLPFKDIIRGDTLDDFKNMDQLTLSLTRPSLKNSRYFQVLEHRTWDKLAKEFVKREKQHISF